MDDWGMLWNRKKEWSKAIRDLDEYIRRRPDVAQAYLCRGGAWAGKREWGKAREDYTAAFRLEPEERRSLRAPHPRDRNRQGR